MKSIKPLYGLLSRLALCVSFLSITFNASTMSVILNENQSNIIIPSDSIVNRQELKTKIEVTASGDTIIKYYYNPYDFGEIYNKISSNQRVRNIQLPDSNPAQALVSDIRILPPRPVPRIVGQIPFNESVSASGAKVISIPILTANVSGPAPQISICYNSQSGNGVAGYGWNLSGLSAITLTNKTQNYDNKTEAPYLSNPQSCAFALDGVRLLQNTESSLPAYQYETAQGSIYVKKVMSGNDVAYFEAMYPNGSKATFGFTDNTTTRLTYPLTLIEDRNGYCAEFEYTSSGNSYYITKIRYGGRCENLPAEIEFNYVDRTDFTTTYVAGQTVSQTKLLKSIVSSDNLNELRTYNLTHDQVSGVCRLTNVGCSIGRESLTPLAFSYDYYSSHSGTKTLNSNYYGQISEYFNHDSKHPLQYVRGKFRSGKYGDGIIIYPGGYSTYGKRGTQYRWEGSKKVGYDIYGSLYPADQKILIIPHLDHYNTPIEITAGEGFQTINAVDVNGDGVDEIVKVNFGEYTGMSYELKMTVYTFTSENQYTSTTYVNYLANVINNNNVTFSPYPHSYLFGDFKGIGKAQILSISNDITSGIQPSPSEFSLISLSVSNTCEKSYLFNLPYYAANRVLALDMDGDSKTEICHFANNAFRIYGYNGSKFAVNHESGSVPSGILAEHALICDLNGDGKLDAVIPPEKSYKNTQMEQIPVWAPHYCPSCSIKDPIQMYGEQNCKSCGTNLKDYYEQHLEYTTCRECGDHLQMKISDYNYPLRYDLHCDKDGFSTITEIETSSFDGGNLWTCYINTGLGFVTSTQTICPLWFSETATAADVNRDGLSDLLISGYGTTSVWLNDNGLYRRDDTVEPITAPFSITQLVPANVLNFHGASSLIDVGYGGISTIEFDRDETKANLLTSLKDSFGKQYEYVYSNMTDGSNYATSKTVYSYPYYSCIMPLNLLCSETLRLTPLSDFASNTSYTYIGATAHCKGLGFVGFEKVITKDNIRNTEVIETKNTRSYGETNSISSPLKTINNSYNISKNYTNGKVDIRLWKTEEVDKLTDVTVKSDYSYDKYGNVTKQTQKFGTDLTITTETTYESYLSPQLYLVGLPSRKTVTRTRGYDKWIDKEEVTYDEQTHFPVKRITYTGSTGTHKTGETRWEYDDFGNMTSEKNAPYDVTEFIGTVYSYDIDGRHLLTSTNAKNQTTTYSNFDRYGKARSVTDSKGRETIYNYDNWGNLKSTIGPDGTIATTAIAFGGTGKYTVTAKSTGKPTTVTHYDVAGREIRKGLQCFDGSWQYTDTQYDDCGRISKVSLPFKGTAPTYWNTYAYDEYDRPVQITEASGKTATWTYSGLSTTETKDGISSTKTRDASGAVKSVTDPGGTISYELRPDGQCGYAVVNESTITFDYDMYGRKKTVIDPSSGVMTFNTTYSSDGTKKTTVTDANNKEVTSTYDKYGLLVSVERDEFDTTYEYDSDGLLVKETSTNGTSEEYSYDTYDRPEWIKENGPDGKYLKKSYVYKDGNVEQVTYTSQSEEIASEEYSYAYGHNTEIKLGNGMSIWKLTAENDFGHPTEAMTGNLVRSYSYTTFGMPTGRKVGSLQDFSYDFDVMTGNLTSRTDNTRNLTETFGYDELNRLSSLGEREISYAANGNILSMPGVGEMIYGSDSSPYQITGLIPGDAAVPQREQTVSYTSFQRPDFIEENGVMATFTYNSSGNRVKMNLEENMTLRSSTYYLGGRYELNTGSGDERLYLAGDAYTSPVVYLKQNGDWKLYYICRDYLGSITHIADAEGELVAEYSYDSWGRLRNPETHELYPSGEEPYLLLDRGYTGHEHLPDFGLINMNARLYDSALGRFLSPDPYVQAPDQTQNYNRYSYCLNNPLKYTDPSGKIVWFVPVIIGAVIGAYTGASIQSGTAAFWDWKSDAWKGAIVGGIIGASLGYSFSALIGAGGMTSTTLNGFGELVFGTTKAAGYTSSVLTSGVANIAMDALSGGNWDSAWKAGISGLVSGAWTASGGFGMVKGFGKSMLGRMSGKLGYQMIGSGLNSIGKNWTHGDNLFDNLTIGCGPVNLSFGKGRKLLNWKDNVFNIAMNYFGNINVLFGGDMSFDMENLSVKYSGGLIDKMFPYHPKGYGFGAYSLMGTSEFDDYDHETHHLWHSRTVGDNYLFQYGLQGLNSILTGLDFLRNGNAFEDIAYGRYWW